MKTVDEKLRYIDYTMGSKGIRVRPELCSTIHCFAEHWSERGSTEKIPMTPESLRLPLDGTSWISQIAVSLKEYERPRRNDPSTEDKTELRDLLLGNCIF
jgi:hypothetical protein